METRDLRPYRRARLLLARRGVDIDGAGRHGDVIAPVALFFPRLCRRARAQRCRRGACIRHSETQWPSSSARRVDIRHDLTGPCEARHDARGLKSHCDRDSPNWTHLSRPPHLGSARRTKVLSTTTRPTRDGRRIVRPTGSVSCISHHCAAATIWTSFRPRSDTRFPVIDAFYVRDRNEPRSSTIILVEIQRPIYYA